MNHILLLSILLVLQILTIQSIPWDCPTDSTACLSGGKHKTTASPEDDTYAACLDYKSSSCCTAEFTQQLAQSTVQYIQDGDDIFNWTKCGHLSETCERYFIEIECMYRCDPNMIYFAGDFPSSLDRVPICGQYCDHWYDACKSDLTCVTNWIFDWEYANNTNNCPANSECLTFEERYGSSEQLCNVLWGNTFNYTEESSLCLTPQYPEVNELVTEEIFGDTCTIDDDNDYDKSGPWDCPSDSTACLSGGKHKTTASPEDDSYAACLDYKSSSCCTAEFTQQLNLSTIEYIQDGDDIFNWTKCGPLSEECERYFIEIECMYRCDPNMIYYAGAFPASLNRVPICGQYCDHWYDACKADLSCVTNWIFDWEYANNTNNCPANSECLTFEERYGSSEDLCNVLWGNTFNYTEESSLCLTPQYPEVNQLVTEELFSDICAATPSPTVDEGTTTASPTDDTGESGANDHNMFMMPGILVLLFMNR